MILFNGDLFRGTFRNNERFHGTYFYKNGDVYEGDWKDDLKTGFGKLTMVNGAEYIGNFAEGMKHGEGNYRWSTNDSYNGNFVQDKR